MLGRINTLRGSLGLSGYALNGALNAAAQNHAQWMASTGRVSHTQPDGSTPTSRAAAAGYPSSAVSENIYMGGSATIDSAWGWWMNSPIHYRGITNASYTEVGIGIANGEHGWAFVLVFGNPAGWQAPPSFNPSNTSSAGGGGNAAIAAAPSFIVGQDNYGNIMHEVQPGHTLGEIALIYGYGWDDLEHIREINAMTEEEGRNLSIGGVLLVPPHSGTFTPTPGDPPTITPTVQPTEPPTDAEAAPATATESVNNISIGAILRGSNTPVIIPELSQPELNQPELNQSEAAQPDQPPAPFSVATSAVLPEWVVQTAEAPAVSWQAATMTPTPIAIALADADSAMPPQAAILTPDAPPNTASSGGLSPLLMVAVGIQVVVLGAAVYEFFRRARK